MPVELTEMLTKIKDRQWALADIDWEAPGAEQITAEQWPSLKEFMADLVWIENVGARGFAAMAKQTDDPTLKQIYTYFHAEEQRHANAELALMKRWGMLEGDDLPEPNVNIRLAIEWLDTHADRMPLSVLGTVIPMLEVALDGALLKFLLEEVHDPVCHQVFEKINADESRHLAVDFAVLDILGHAKVRRMVIDSVGSTVSPRVLVGLLVYIPLLSRMRDNIVAMGLDEQRLYTAMKRFAKNGDRTAAVRLPIYQFLKIHADMVIDRAHPYHRLVGDPMVWLSRRYPRFLLKPIPTWFKELTHEPVAGREAA